MAQGNGVRNMTKPGAVDENTIFQLASVTKSLSGAAAASVVDDGKLDWDTHFSLLVRIRRLRSVHDALAGEAVAEYHRCFDAAAIRATCEEFRAAATIDLIHDDADRERKISCPTLLLWSTTSLWATYDMLEVWRSRAEDVQGVALDGGHFLPEENPQRTAAELLRFLL
jgi:haloacetate dehalogenase